MSAIEPYLGAIKALFVIALTIVLFSVGHHFGAQGVQAKWDADKADRLAAEQKATADRLAQNARDKAKQDVINQQVKDAYEKQIADLSARVAAAGRLRVPAAICDQPAGAGQAQGAGSDHAAASVELPAEIDRRLHELARDAEETALQLKAAQDWIRDQGFAP